MIDSAGAQLSGSPGDVSWVATVFVFLSVAASVAGICFRVIYAGRRRGVGSAPPPSFSPAQARPRRSSGWAIYDEQSARSAARQGMWAAFFVAGATGVAAYLAGNGIPLVPGITSAGWIDAAIFAALGIGFMRMSRAAAVGALVLYIVERSWAMQYTGFSPIAIPMIACFAQSVRGTFAYHNYRRQSPYAPYGSGLPTPYAARKLDL